MNYRTEREHDQLLICLLNDLNSVNRLDIVGEAFQIEFWAHLNEQPIDNPLM